MVIPLKLLSPSEVILCLQLVLVVVLSAIFNSTFHVGSIASNEISVVGGGTLSSVMISFSNFKYIYSNFTSEKGHSWDMKLTVSQSHTWFVLVK